MSSALTERSACIPIPQKNAKGASFKSECKNDKELLALQATGTSNDDVLSNLLGVIKRNTVVLPLLYGEFWCSAAFSLMQPFFPILATSKDLPAWKYGFVFSFYRVSMLFGSQLTPQMLKRTSPTTCYVIGLVGFFLFNIILGCLYWIPDGNNLLVASFAAVVLGGFTNLVYLVSSYSILTMQYPKSEGALIAFLFLIFTTGNMVGSSVGGILVDLWAYPLPFFVMGSLIIVPIPWIIKFRKHLNKLPGRSSSEEIHKEEGKPYWRLLLDPQFLNNMITIMTAWLIMGYNEPTLEPSLKEFGLQVKKIGGCFGIQFASSSVGAVLAGVFCHFEFDAFYALVGHCFGVCAFLILEPAPFIPYERSLWMIYLSLILTGLSIASMFVCGYCNTLKIVGLRGYPDTIRTKAFVSSAVFTAQVLGGMIMPPIAGHLVDALGFRKASVSMFGLLTALALVRVVVCLVTATSSRIFDNYEMMPND